MEKAHDLAAVPSISPKSKGSKSNGFAMAAKIVSEGSTK